MPECHKCPWNMKGKKKCLTCGGPPKGSVNHGKTHISLEHAPEFETALVPIEKPRIDRRFEALAQFMRAWFRLTIQDRNILSQLVIDSSQTESTLARRYRVSPQAIQQRLIALAEKYPEIKAVLKPKIKALR